MIEWILAILVVIALIGGWFSGRFSLKRQQLARAPRLTADYYRGLNYLLNEKPDKALEVFLHLVEVDGSTIETHITLGKLFRRKGEIEKAIRIHQNLIARPTLSGADRSESLLELGRDYIAAGVYDRAERLLKEVCDTGHFRLQATKALLDIYVQEQEWLVAVDTAESLSKLSGESESSQIAHFYCELAKTALKKTDEELARRYLQKAHIKDGHSLRANLMRGDLEYKAGNTSEALGFYVRVIELDSRFASEVLPKIQLCIEQSGNKRLNRQLEALFNRLKRDGIYVQPLTRQIQDREGIQEAKNYLEKIMDNQPGIDPMKDWLDLHPVAVEPALVKTQLAKLESSTYPYQCEQCGYNSRKIQWHCPSCLSWGSIYPNYR